MAILAMYIPKFDDPYDWMRLAVICGIFVAAFAWGRRRFGAIQTGLVLLAGWVLALYHGLSEYLTDDLGEYGDWCREANSCSLPDWCFELYMYFDVEWGALISVGGIIGGLAALAVCVIDAFPSSAT